MSRIAYVNGRYVPHRAASVHVEDRGYQFADGVYEVIAVANGKLIDGGPHLDRLERSLRELRMTPPMGRRALELVMREVVRRNGVDNGIIYLQMTRGVAPRDHAFPARAETQVVMTARRARPQAARIAEDGVKAITMPDIRWQRCDIKSVSLLPNILAKQQAKEAGAYEAWLVDRNGMVTEGSSTNAWIVTRDGQLVTRSIENAILAGITRMAVIEMARAEGLVPGRAAVFGHRGEGGARGVRDIDVVLCHAGDADRRPGHRQRQAGIDQPEAARAVHSLHGRRAGRIAGRGGLKPRLAWRSGKRI